MTSAALDGRQIATAIIFVGTLTGVALGRIPGLRIDRAGIALVGASLMLVFGKLSFEEALRTIDLDTIALLLGTMIIVAQLRISGFFDLAGHFAIDRARGPIMLLSAIIAITGLFSAFLVNDAICLVMAPLVVHVTQALRRNPVPYLLAVAMASNAGSVATFTGNPQNMIIGLASRIPYAAFTVKLAPTAAAALLLTLILIALFYPREFFSPFTNVKAEPGGNHDPRQLRKGAFVTAGVVASFFVGAPAAKAALIGGSLLLISRSVKPQRIYALVDGQLLLMFAGLFVVIAAAHEAFLASSAMAAARLHLENPWALSGVTAALSNLVSNVPAVLILKPWMANLPDPRQAWLIVAMSSTLAGNLTLLGSVANLIVAEKARKDGVHLSFLAYLAVGLPLTLLSLCFGTWWLAGWTKL
ncbi:anion transporter [Methylocapsa palsarum]|uniref:Na+/H+ antiporter NhaD n=1 Tax=Methylocapsa palsarum TaxID=1612308 RepID=A0A1I3Y8F9_9HYPH|nr:anion transporter [Methylocapsa palsarum]SFK28105.1 Na+/H+ antiporter NhaD [Methylocapsa palsarum]